MPYTTEQWLVDRAYINDTISAFHLYGDTGDWDSFAKYFCAPKIIRDYSELFGSDLEHFTAQEYAEARRNNFAEVTRTQHIVTSVLNNLPTPGESVNVPNETTIDAYVDAHIIKEGTEGGDVLSCGGRYRLEFRRMSPEELSSHVGENGRVGNPWRVTLLKAFPGFVYGNRKVMGW